MELLHRWDGMKVVVFKSFGMLNAKIASGLSYIIDFWPFFLIKVENYKNTMLIKKNPVHNETKQTSKLCSTSKVMLGEL